MTGLTFTCTICEFPYTDGLTGDADEGICDECERVMNDLWEERGYWPSGEEVKERRKEE